MPDDSRSSRALLLEARALLAEIPLNAPNTIGLRAADLGGRIDAAPVSEIAGPVAWRYRYKGEPGEQGEWKYVEAESLCNSRLTYERQPLYAEWSMVTAPESALPKPDAVSLVGKKSIQLSYFGDVTPGEAKAAFERWIA